MIFLIIVPKIYGALVLSRVRSRIFSHTVCQASQMVLLYVQTFRGANTARLAADYGS